MLNATVGQLFVNEALPEDLRDYDRVLDKKELKKVLHEVATRYPNDYREISFALNNIGREGAQEGGSFSFGLRHLKRSKAGHRIRERVRAKMDAILSRDDITDKKRNELIVRAVGSEMAPQQAEIMAEALEDKNPLAFQVLSGTRGNRMNLSSLLGSDLLYADQRDDPLPIPVTRSYSEGLSPAEYWAGSYGARKGIIATKFATQDAGFLAKQLNQVAHRLVITDKDYADEGQRGIKRGMPVDTEDADSEGALLAIDTGPYEKNTVITPKVRKHLKRLGKNKILIRSPLVGGSPSGGVYARDVGVRETGRLPGRGTQVGLQAAQSLSEPLSQGQLSAKHSGGVAGEEKAVSGFKYINQLIQVPKTFKGGAAHTTEDGTVQRIEDAPAGGKYVTVNDKQHYVADGYDIHVKKGDKVEAGDVISEGFPNPSLVTQYKGIGDGRKYFVKALKEAMEGANLSAHRRNIEILSRGLINHVRLTEEYGDNVPDDVVPYSTLEHKWKPREGHRSVKPKQAVGKYLEQPVLHYTIGTKIRPSMLAEFNAFGVDEVAVHNDPPPFEPEMIRGMSNLQHDPDWLTRFYGSGLKKSLLTGAQRGAVSEERGTSFVPSISRSVDFGRAPGAIVRPPSPGYPVEEIGEVKTAQNTVPPAQNTQDAEWNRIHSYGDFTYDPNRYSSLSPSRSKQLQQRKWQHEQLRNYQNTYGHSGPRPGSPVHQISESMQSSNILDTSPQPDPYTPPATITPPSQTSTSGNTQNTVPPAQNTGSVPPVTNPHTPKPMPVNVPAAKQNLSDGSFITGNVAKPYNPAQRVQGYRKGGVQSQQQLPGLFNTPFFGPRFTQAVQGYGGAAGGMALAAGLNPQGALTALSEGKNTTARLGGLSDAFYNAHNQRPLEDYDRKSNWFEWGHEEPEYQAEKARRENWDPSQIWAKNAPPKPQRSLDSYDRDNWGWFEGGHEEEAYQQALKDREGVYR
tara:strand:+ start:8301 stop:11198 length:2898 start_codon:yes stop_codon:yes gene_type:complete